MTRAGQRLLFWLPRVLSICIALFIGMFALDTFSEHSGFWQTTGAFMMHLIPAFILIVATIIGWRWEFAGGVLFIGAGIIYWTMVPHHPAWILVISGPLFIIGLLYFWGYFTRKQIQSTSTDT